MKARELLDMITGMLLFEGVNISIVKLQRHILNSKILDICTSQTPTIPSTMNNCQFTTFIRCILLHIPVFFLMDRHSQQNKIAMNMLSLQLKPGRKWTTKTPLHIVILSYSWAFYLYQNLMSSNLGRIVTVVCDKSRGFCSPQQGICNRK